MFCSGQRPPWQRMAGAESSVTRCKKPLSDVARPHDMSIFRLRGSASGLGKRNWPVGLSNETPTLSEPMKRERRKESVDEQGFGEMSTSLLPLSKQKSGCHGQNAGGMQAREQANSQRKHREHELLTRVARVR